MRRTNSPKVVFWKKSFLSYFGVGCWFIKSFNENRGSMSKIRHVFKRVLFPVPLPVLREVSAELENKTNLFFSTADFAGNDLEDVATMIRHRLLTGTHHDIMIMIHRDHIITVRHNHIIMIHYRLNGTSSWSQSSRVRKGRLRGSRGARYYQNLKKI